MLKILQQMLFVDTGYYRLKVVCIQVTKIQKKEGNYWGTITQ